jgi:taurine dioxygenase
MHYKHFDLDPITGALGGEIHGIDLSEPVDDEMLQEIYDALLQNLVLFFRDQHITPAQQIEFGRRFGELHVHPLIPHLKGYPEILALGGGEGPRPQTRNSNVWHADLTYIATPPMGSILRGVEVPEAGGDTMWTNMYAAYDALSERMKRFLSDLSAVHDIAKTSRREDLSTKAGVDRFWKSQETTPPVTHPVIRIHPEINQKCIFVSRAFTTHIPDLEPRESESVLRFLMEHIEKPEFQCRFHWRKDSIAFWDNRCTQHYAVVDYSERRTMHRVTICGDQPH